MCTYSVTSLETEDGSVLCLFFHSNERPVAIAEVSVLGVRVTLSSISRAELIFTMTHSGWDAESFEQPSPSGG